MSVLFVATVLSRIFSVQLLLLVLVISANQQRRQSSPQCLESLALFQLLQILRRCAPLEDTLNTARLCWRITGLRIEFGVSEVSWHREVKFSCPHAIGRLNGLETHGFPIPFHRGCLIVLGQSGEGDGGNLWCHADPIERGRNGENISLAARPDGKMRDTLDMLQALWASIFIRRSQKPGRLWCIGVKIKFILFENRREFPDCHSS